MDIDKKDRKIMNLLQRDGRMKLKDIARDVGLSIDSVHKRIKKLIENNAMEIRALVKPKSIGFDLVAVVNIKLHNAGEKEHQEFIDYLVRSPNTIEVISTLGNHDIMCAFIATSTENLEKIYRSVRHQFKDIIADWESGINLKVHKFEEYAL